MAVGGEKSWTDEGFLELWLAKILSDSMRVRGTHRTVRFTEMSGCESPN